ncbi:MAG: helical backbone metal receptor [Chthoniobacterales bacterium]
MLLRRDLLPWLLCGCLVPPAAGHGTEPPARVASLAPNLTAMVRQLGAGSSLAAVTPFCQAPAEVLRLTAGIQPAAEEVLALDPDLVLATSMTPAATRAQLTRLGLRVEVIEAGSLASIEAALARVARMLGVSPPPATVRTSRARDRSAALLFGADTGFSAGCGTHAHEILEAAGLRNIAAEAGGPWPQLGEEFLLAADPDVIVVADYGGTKREDVLKTLQRHPVRRHLAAVRSGRIVIFPAPVFSVPGPAALEAGESLRAEVDKL